MKNRAQKLSSPIIPSFLAGVINGLLGTGGGIPLFFYLTKQGKGKGAYATASVAILLLSLQTLFLYREKDVTPNLVSPFLPMLAVVGGALGAWLCGKIDRRILLLIFGILLLLSGSYLIGKEICLAIS